jgi:hypothetical protein
MFYGRDRGVENREARGVGRGQSANSPLWLFGSDAKRATRADTTSTSRSRLDRCRYEETIAY